MRAQDLDVAMQNETFESRDLFKRAEMQIQRQGYDEARLLLEEALKIVPINPVYISHLGLCIGMDGNLPEGERICREAIKLAPKDPILYVNLGRILLEMGKRQEARAEFTHAYRLDNTNAPAALELSRMGIRRPPVIPFLHRNHPLNIYLGRLRHRWLYLKRPNWKKL